jgi:GntR family transcriptional repressor for pyruvate dehydrogenase complex
MDKLKIGNNQTTLVDQVEEKILDFFKSNNIVPGDPIPKEMDLAEALGVGRSVLREALSRLRMLGLIETRPKRGMILSEPSLLGGIRKVIDPRILGDEALFNLLGLRIALEMGISPMVFQNLNDEYLIQLSDIVNRGVLYANNQYMPVSEYEFHAKLFEIAGNKTVMEFQEIIYPVSIFVKNKFQDIFEPINKAIEKKGQLVSHKDLFEYIKKRDKEGFQKALENHFALYTIFLNNNNKK